MYFLILRTFTIISFKLEFIFMVLSVRFFGRQGENKYAIKSKSLSINFVNHFRLWLSNGRKDVESL